MQRLALCRALVYEPDLLLLDEPFSNLDAKLREQMRVEVKLLQRRLGITVLFVTHDQIEALSLSDRIAVMQRGRVEQVGAAAQPLRAAGLRLRARLPRPDRAAARPRRPGARRPASRRVTVAMNGAARRTLPRGPAGAGGDRSRPGAAASVAIRPEDIGVAPDDRACPDAHALPGVIDTLLFVGDRYEARVTLGGEHSILLLLPRAREWREGQRRAARLPARDW